MESNNSSNLKDFQQKLGITDEMWKAFIEGLKEVGRLVLFAAISTLISAGLAQLEIIENPSVWVLMLTSLLRYFDKYLHVLGKQENNPNLKKGLTFF